ncbi:MAG: hypothetical protein QOJ70_3020 [Acidobacteriota bacterium]|jgi:hypothetical protein|nr:hypothetical protein [Acidobacteriota bacterium]
MKKALLFIGVCSLTVFLMAVLVGLTAPQVGMTIVKAQTCCNPPPASWPTANWPKNTVVHVQIQAGVFDDVEVDAIKAAFRAWNARSLDNCSNVTYPEPYELVDTPPSHSGHVFYVRYDGEYTAPKQGITTGSGVESVFIYSQTTLFRNMRELGLPQFKGAFVKG